ncbi:N-methyl-L-tryptophan oxidase [Agrobacterium vitis]|uniref:N-methyl-L-tryptophan oxidase n=1 Tax=Rhizobium/Agrobacterium group TaxID=227290 RepID=UPI0012E98A5F|nr:MULTISPECIES: N-methyl-L-tryptophan oxidase [Rhizobium/Agrobacterium group]MCF1495766.1 N-methyl-L-tryptophan oxidase [Allorhizobium ampelinum]MVA45799.1 N-methyl-L-tryptophan oxidase [Agrobacterium vitis]
MDTHSIDFSVIGLGAVGAATLYQLARRGAKVVGIDRHLPPHPFGSSHGCARLTRNAVGEGSAYVPLVKRSQEILSDLERTFNADLMERAGTLIIGSEQPTHGDDFVAATVKIAQQHGIEHELFSSAELKRRYPQLIGLTDTDFGYFEPKGGFMKPEPIVSLQISAAQQLGATVLTDRAVEHVSQENGWVIIGMGEYQIRARHAVIAAGRWAGEILGPPYDRLLKVTEQRAFSFRPEAAARYQAGNFPALMWFRSGAGNRCITTFPQSQDGTVSFFVEGIDVAADVGETGGHFFEQEIRPFFNGITPQIVGSDLCYYTLTPDGGFIIDRPPGNDRILVISACSGHGFKHSLAVGELAAQMLLREGTTCDATSFSVGRFCA